MHYNNLLSPLWCLSLVSGLLIFRKCACLTSVYFLGRSKVPLLQIILQWQGLSGQTAGKEVSKAIWVTKVEMTPVLPFHQAPSFSGFEIDLFTDSSISPNVHGLSLLFILEQIHVSKFSSFLCILIPGWTGLDVRYTFQAFKIVISSLNSSGERW